MAKIKITGDVGEIKKSLLDLSKDVQSLGKSKVSIFDKEQRDFLSKEAKAHMGDLRKEMVKNKKEIAGALKLQKAQTKSVQDEIKNREKVTKLVQKQVKLQREMQNMQKASSTFGGGSGGGMMGKLKGMGGMMGKGMLGGLARFAGPAGILGAAGAFGISRGMKAHGVFKGGVSDRLGLRGRGVGDMDLEDRAGAAGAGLNAQSMRRARLQSMDVFGAKGSTQQAVTQRASVERNFGMESGTMAGLGGQLRGQMGGEGADKAVMTIQAGLIASGITDEIGPYLETAANMLQNLNENGFTFNDSAMAVLNNLTASGVSSERAGRMITGVDKAIRGSSGEANAFFQQVFKDAGIGGNTVGGIQASMRSGGLFGADVDKANLGKEDTAMFKRLGMGSGSGSKIAKSMVSNFDTLFGSQEQLGQMDQGAADTKRLQRNNMIMNTFGLENEVQGGEVYKLLTDMADPKKTAKEKAKIEKKLKSITEGNTELGNLKLINESLAGQTSILEDTHKSLQDELGGKVAPAVMAIERILMNIDMGISAMLDFLGVETPKEAMEEALKGTDTMSQENFDSVTMNNPRAQAELSKKFADEFSKKQSRIKELEAGGADKDFTVGHKGGMRKGADLLELEKLREEKRNMLESSRNIKGLNVIKAFGKDKEGRKDFTKSQLDGIKKEMEYNQTTAGQIQNFFKAMFSDDDEKYAPKKGKGKNEAAEKAAMDKKKLEIAKKGVEATNNVARNLGKVSAEAPGRDKTGIK